MCHFSFLRSILNKRIVKNHEYDLFFYTKKNISFQKKCFQIWNLLTTLILHFSYRSVITEQFSSAKSREKKFSQLAEHIHDLLEAFKVCSGMFSFLFTMLRLLCSSCLRHFWGVSNKKNMLLIFGIFYCNELYFSYDSEYKYVHLENFMPVFWNIC